MRVLVSDLTNTELTNRLARIESYMIKLQDRMHTGEQGYKQHLTRLKWKGTLHLYADIIYEAAHRKLLTIH